jgi:hypothetical protein
MGKNPHEDIVAKLGEKHWSTVGYGCGRTGRIMVL